MTGTDTGVGKTLVADGAGPRPQPDGRRDTRAETARERGDAHAQGLRNADALALQAEGRPRASYELVNPCCFEPAIAPHLAAAEAGVDTPLAGAARLVRTGDARTATARSSRAPAAGVCRCIRSGYTSDLPEALGLPVLLVVGMRLGCLNHARLTFEAIRAAGRAPFAGWIGNRIDPRIRARRGEPGHARATARALHRWP